jgi:hypothetical protein
MSSFRDLFKKEDLQKIFKAGLNRGDVFIHDFPGIDHLKMFIVIGISRDIVFTCSVYINSKIHPFIARDAHLLSLQIPLLKSDNPFLDHDSYASCNSPIKSSSEVIQSKIDDKTCQVIGQICANDLGKITVTLKESGVLTVEEVQLYFS